VLVVPADSELAARRSASLADIGETPVIGSQTCSSGLLAEAVIREQGHELDYAFRSDDNGTIQGLVAAGFGVALWPLLAVTPGDDRVRVLALEPPVPPRTIAVVWHSDRHRSPAARAFVELAREVCEAVERDLPSPGSTGPA
jgi:DNA-binding transcriptional LysR family regulator